MKTLCWIGISKKFHLPTADPTKFRVAINYILDQVGGGFELASLAVNQKRLPETDGTIFLAKNMWQIWHLMKYSWMGNFRFFNKAHEHLFT